MKGTTNFTGKIGPVLPGFLWDSEITGLTNDRVRYIETSMVQTNQMVYNAAFATNVPFAGQTDKDQRGWEVDVTRLLLRYDATSGGIRWK